MELKEYQKKCLRKITQYFEALKKYEEAKIKILQLSEESAYLMDCPQLAWTEVVKNTVRSNEDKNITYKPKKNGLQNDLPNFCLKVPTGGGKTLLAVHTIDIINTNYRKQKTGLVLWIVPTDQIYRQTFQSLSDREHPYRQVLDISSGGRTQIIEKFDRFTPDDVKENLVILMLMLPSANRRNKETLKLFQDTGGFEAFFPPEDRLSEHQALLEKYSNLDYFGNSGTFFGKQIKTSLGNTIRLLKPIIIIDEGQKAYSENAQKTIRDFNPSVVVELSATPAKGSNILVSISGQELNDEEMIKFDIHVTNKASGNWKDTLNASVEQRKRLEEKAREYEATTGIYIRPICLIQVERTGKSQLESGFIHAQDAVDYLVQELGIAQEEVAVKSSEKDDIEDIDLYERSCPIRYIITKHALQEGWDCSFAYVLSILTNPSSENGLTQLVGRILRQPFGTKTRIKELDESYVFCYQQRANDIMESIKLGLETEGLGDIIDGIVNHGDGHEEMKNGETSIKLRKTFEHFDGKVYLPRFVVQEEGAWRPLDYDMDIMSKVDWSEISLKAVHDLKLSNSIAQDETIDIGLSDSSDILIERKGYHTKHNGTDLNCLLITRRIMDIVPNPWTAYEIVNRAISILRESYSYSLIESNSVFITEELEKILAKETDRLAEKIFREMLEKKQLQFFLQQGKLKIPRRKIIVRAQDKRLTRYNGEPLEKSLVEPVLKRDFNDTESSIAICLDSQEKLLWWYRNIAKVDYYVQGWKRQRIYPDFLFTKSDIEKKDDFSMVYVVETKGIYLKNEDTAYKQAIFDLCNELGKKTSWNALELEFKDKRVEFKVIFDDEWKAKINQIFA